MKANSSFNLKFIFFSVVGEASNFYQFGRFAPSIRITAITLYQMSFFFFIQSFLPTAELSFCLSQLTGFNRSYVCFFFFLHGTKMTALS